MSTVIQIEPELMKQAEDVLGKIGMSFSQAVNLFTRQIVLRRSFPIELNVPDDVPVLHMDSLTDEELTAAFEKGMDDIEAGHCHTSEEVRRIMEADDGEF